MKTKLLIISFLLSLNSFGQKLPITNLCLSDIVAVTGGTCLSDAFTNANSGYFDATYAIAGANWLSEFRNYGLSITAPTVTTASITSITGTTATGGGNVTSDGGASVTARGVCWNTSTNPTVSNSHTSDGTGTGSYSSSLTSLTASTTYYVRAYATNSVGTSYGSNVSFTTGPVCPNLGDFYQGGYVFYILQPGDTGYSSTTCHGLISSGITSTSAWGCSGDLLSGCSGFDYGDGASNTFQIEAQCPDVSVAARRCTETTLYGYSDWYLPSTSEVMQFMVGYTYSGANRSYSYWTSTQINSTTAYGIRYTTIYETYSESKASAIYYTPIRSF